MDPAALRCPCAEKTALRDGPDGLRCAGRGCAHADGAPFRIVDGAPVLIAPDRCDTLCDPSRVASYVPRAEGDGGWKRRLRRALTTGAPTVTRANCDAFLAALRALSPAPRALVIGAGTQGHGAEALWAAPDLSRTGTDIYASPSVDVVADGHHLPFADGAFEGVWIQAVLEHVADPQAVTAEIHRVLAPGGVVYAETPFMQQVHEGAYDFTRWTVLGHRYLFRDFEALGFGGMNGADVVLSWSARYWAWALTRSRAVGGAAGLLAGLLTLPFRGRLAPESLHDSASGVWFLGRRAERRLAQAELPTLYGGLFPRPD